jgi:hypothetical protein
MKFKDTIKVYDQAFTVEECKQLIDRQEQAIEEDLAYKGMSGDGVNEYKKSIDYNILGQNNDLDDNLSKMVMDKFNLFTDKYLQDYPHVEEYRHGMIVEDKTGYPLLQIQKYEQNSGHYNAWHVEKENLDTSRRQFVYILYLNDVEKGGETGFLFKEEGSDDFFKVEPKVGKLIIHTKSWHYVHKGYMPESDDKYILTTWLQYTE